MCCRPGLVMFLLIWLSMIRGWSIVSQMYSHFFCQITGLPPVKCKPECDDAHDLQNQSPCDQASQPETLHPLQRPQLIIDLGQKLGDHQFLKFKVSG